MDAMDETREPARSRATLVPAAALLVLYLSWQALRWIPGTQQLVGGLLMFALSATAAAAAWAASRRAASSLRLRRAWRLVALAIAAQAAGAVAQLIYEYVLHRRPYPTLADPLYLAFYPLLLAGILSFPALPQVRSQARQLALDCAVVALGGGAVFVYAILGPDAVAGASPLELVTTIAYPVGDVILLVGLAAALLRTVRADVRASLTWIGAAVGLFVVGDLVYGYVVLHTAYKGGDPVDTLYAVAFACFAVAASVQRRVDEADRPLPLAPARADALVEWAPRVGVAASMAALLAAEWGEVVFPNLVLVMIAIVVATLLALRLQLTLRDMRQERTRLAEAQAIAQVGSWEWDAAHDRFERSAQEWRLLGRDPATLADGAAAAIEVVHPDDRERVERETWAAVEARLPFAYELRVVHTDGDVRTLLARGAAVFRGDQLVSLRGTHQDVTDRKALEARLRDQADHDPLTGLLNRRRFAEELERILRYAARYERPGAVLMLDLDNLKLLNDAHGHAAGDEALRLVGRTLAGRARDTDVVARLSGDEFAIVLPEADEQQALAAAESVRLSLGAASGERRVHVSAGVALFDGREGLLGDDVLAAADLALYEAKEGGRDQVRVYRGQATGSLSWGERIREALEQDRFVLYAQPMVDLARGKVTHRELLVRMLSDDGDAIPPQRFLPTAERLGLVGEIDRWVVREGLRMACSGEPVSINLSAASIGDEEILNAVWHAVEEGMPPANAIFELTETAAVHNMEGARRFAAALTRLGCEVALDDFGTGFGSFSYLKHLPTRYVKIDMEFVRDVAANATDQQLVKSITDVAHSLGKRAIAEGVEDRETLEALRAYGVDGVQGFYLGRPLRISPETRFERELRGDAPLAAPR